MERISFDFSKFVELGTKIGKLSLEIGAIFTACSWFLTLYFAKEIEYYNQLIEFKSVYESEIEPKLDSINKIQSKEIHSLKKRLDDKEKTFSIGLRVDEHNDIFYRSIDRKLYRAYSRNYDGYLYWYYTDKEGREQIAY